MSVPFFYEPTIASGTTLFTLTEENSKHCAQVLRMQLNDALTITNGMGGLFEGVIQSSHKKTTIVAIKNSHFIPASAQKITLGISLLKNTVRLEWLFEKVTEMGVYQIIPLLCERTVHERFKMERMQHIIQSAMVQSQQAWLPILSTPTAFETCIDAHSSTQGLIAHCNHTDKKSIKEFAGSNISDEIMVLIGPEGDFTDKEIAKAIHANFTAIHLGQNRLRTETAGIFAVSVLKKI